MTINDYVKAKKGTLEGCLTCPLCFNLFEEATTSCLCLHTFCKKCIYQKLEESLTNCCPLCNEYLGSCPKEKLRPDNNLQELKNKIFPSKKARDVKSNETPATQRKATLASLPNAPKARRTKESVKTTKVSAKNDKLDKIPEKNHHGAASELESSTKTPVVYNKQRVKSAEDPSRIGKRSTHKQAKADKLSVPAETSNGRDDINGPLLSLPEVCLDKEEPNKKIPTREKIRSRKSIPFKSPGLVDLNEKLESETEIKPKERSQPNTSDVRELKNPREQRFGASTSRGFEEESVTRSYPVWFTLHGCGNKRGESYPQIPKPYIKINDGNMPVSTVKKYLVQKLNLIHESEVEVMCCGQPLDPIATLDSVTEMWVKNTNGHIRIKSSDVQNFIMVLTYRKR
ncbi:E3 ubiquitin protein ligase DRIP2-like [Papaver somniferum]|uniref:E3 ubiquitin protein ligase DRIP2-like n=1 Tax=Papaver somniferum TaxID=3469 RepID=UPI000E6FB15A|nr:E3 ubiquitin protein ligase DRIP2-like [Papaver somniferum]